MLRVARLLSCQRRLLRAMKPDFKTIADFRSGNRSTFKKVFREFVVLCRRLDLIGRELLAVDGSRIKAHPGSACLTAQASQVCSKPRFMLNPPA
jgi:transposase